MKRKAVYLKAMEIDVWAPKKKEDIVSNEMASNEIASMDWDTLEKTVSACTACSLHKTRTRAVFGVGSREADLLVVGEAPGANEDLQGEPFVGRAGQLLNSMLQSIGLSRETIYIANILKSRPPENRDPTPEEVAICTPFLQRQITLLKPKLILAVGRIAAHHLLSTEAPMSSLRGHELSYGAAQVPVVVTYHPAYLLRAPREKRKAWIDMQRVQKILMVER